MKIADHAQKLIQEGAKNNLEGVLRCPIKMSTISENMIEGQLIHSEIVHSCSKGALQASQQKIPFGKYALYFIDDKFSCPLTNCIQLFLDRTNVKGASSIAASIVPIKSSINSSSSSDIFKSNMDFALWKRADISPILAAMSESIS